MNFRALALLATVAAAARVPTHPPQQKVAEPHHLVAKSKQAPKEMPPKCVEAMKKMKEPEFAEEAAKCEQDGQYPQKAIAALQKRDEAGATAHIEDLFVNCAKLPKDCAALVAPDLVIQLRFSGAAVSPDCAQKMEEVQGNKQKAKEMEECDKKEKLTENVLAELSKDDLKGAVSAAEAGLEKCLSMSKECSYQIAPVLVNSVLMRAMMQQGQQQEAPMTTVMVAQPMIIVEEPVMVVEEVPATKSAAKAVAKSSASTKKHGTPSLLAMAAAKGPLAPRPRGLRRAAAPSLIQESTHHHAYVSKLIMQLAKL